MNDKDAITDLYHEMYSAMIRKDSAKLAEILDDEFVLVHMTGMRQPKRDYISAIANGTLNYYSEDTESKKQDILPIGILAPDREGAPVSEWVSAVNPDGKMKVTLPMKAVCIVKDNWTEN